MIEDADFEDDSDSGPEPTKVDEKLVLLPQVFEQLIIQEFGDSIVADVLDEFAETMLEPMIARYSLFSAKGTTEKKYAHLSDQTMLSHVFNGLFPTLKLVYECQLREFGRVSGLDNLYLKLYVLAYSMHDLDKILHEALKTRQSDGIALARQKLLDELKLIGGYEFLPGLEEWAGFILWLAVNTQREWDINLNQHSFIDNNFVELVEGQAAKRPDTNGISSVLRDLCTYSDKIAYLVKSPEEALYSSAATRKSSDSLINLLISISGGNFNFAYHKLSEVRGFLSNYINNAVAGYIQEFAAEPLIPYLFFPNGVVYLNPQPRAELKIDRDIINERVKTELQTACAEKVSEGGSFGFSQLGLLKYPGYLHDFLSPADFLKLFARKTRLDSRENVAESTLQKMKEMQAQKLIPAELKLDYNPDARVTMLGRFLINYLRLADQLVRQPARAVLQQELVQELGEEIWQTARQIPSNGGLDYRYYWVAAQYLKAHALAANEGDSPGNSLESWFERWLARLQELAGPELSQTPALQGPYMPYLPDYLNKTLSFGFGKEVAIEPANFGGELAKYTAAKQPRANQLACTICNSAYPVSEQEDSSVLFQPWVYKNRLPLYKGSNAGGICVICSLELMLRQVLLDVGKKTGKKFESDEIKYFFIYPAFFFTGVTGRLAQLILSELKNLKVFEVATQLRGKDTISSDVILNMRFFKLNLSDYNDFDNDEKKNKQSNGYLFNRSPDGQYPGFMFFGKRSFSKESGAAATTASWVEAAWLGLALPLVLGARVVVSEMYLPLFNSAADFKETVILDAPHAAVRYLLGNSSPENNQPASLNRPSAEARLRLDELYGPMNQRDALNTIGGSLAAFSRAIEVQIDTEATGPDPRLGRFNRIARELATDKLNLFSFLQEQVRKAELNAMPLEKAHHYTKIYEQLGGTMIHHRETVKLYLDFYSPFSATPGGKYPASRAIVQPVDIAAKRIITDTLNLSEEEIKLEMRQELHNWLDRIRRGEATGRTTARKGDEERARIIAFVDYFYKEVFMGYAEGERSILNSRLNRFKNGCEASFSDLMYERRQARLKEGQNTEELPDPSAPTDDDE